MSQVYGSEKQTEATKQNKTKHGIPLPWVDSIKILGYTLNIRRGRATPKTKTIVRGALHQCKVALSATSPIPLYTQLIVLKATIDCKALYTAPLEDMDYHKMDQANSIALCYITGAHIIPALIDHLPRKYRIAD